MRLLLTIIIISSPHFVFSQKYWQQEVNYTINVKLDDVKHELFADETIEYINNSPDVLTFIYFHVWPNAYKNNKTALGKQLKENNELKFYFAKEEDRGYIDQLNFTVNSESVKWEYDKEHIDICKLILNKPLQPNEKIIIATPFHVKIPLGEFSRLGHIEQQYQITQWYPKPAVYDKDGWHQMPYLDQGEFYSEFGSFDVSITLPKNYVLGATGDLFNNDDEIKWLNKIADETKYKDWEKKKIITENGKSKSTNFYNDSFPISSSELKTLRYKQSNVHDFAWFCDKRYNVLKGEVTLPHSKNTVTTWVMFTNENASLWKNSIPYMNDAIYYYSKWNGDYPYQHATAVDGALSAGGGMEYPNITVIGNVNNAFSLETVIMHEVGHNWFYGILGSNERMHAWMDEGINSANECRYIETKYPDHKLLGNFGNSPIAKKLDLSQYLHKSQYELLYLINAKTNTDQPVEFPSYEYTSMNYGGIVYSKTAICFDYLKAYLGEDLYDECMMEYFDKWKFKHPQPEDLKKIFTDKTGKNLDWLFVDLIQTTKKLDYKIISFNKTTGEVTLKNTGEINGPVCISGLDENGKAQKTIWVEGFGGTKKILLESYDYSSIRIDHMLEMPEINRNNNILKTKGICKKSEPFKLQFLGSLDNPEKRQLYWVPAFGWNNYDKFMIGAAIYNNILPEKKTEFLIMPFYSTGDKKSIAGSANLTIHFHPDKIFQNIELSGNASRYAYNDFPFKVNKSNFTKFSSTLRFDFKKQRLRSPYIHSFSFRAMQIFKDSYGYSISDTAQPYVVSYVQGSDDNAFYEAAYNFTFGGKILPVKSNITLQHHQYFDKLLMTVNLKYAVSKKHKIALRLFAGKVLGNSILTSQYLFRISGLKGEYDYLFDHVFLGRSENEGLLGAQFAEADGAFKIGYTAGASNNMMLSANLKTDLPFIPVKVYVDAGYYDDYLSSNPLFLYNAGFFISFKEYLEVYFPVAYSNEIKKSFGSNHKYIENIRFSLKLNMLNPFAIIKSFSI